MASMVLSAFDLDLSGVSVLDAFAGSGAIGLELLSRGADHATFVDRDRKALARIRRNVRSLGASSDQATVVAGDVHAIAGRGSLAGAPFSLVVLDPPYAMEASRVSELVEALAGEGLLAQGAVVLYERDAKSPGLEVPGFAHMREKGHGTTCVELLRRNDAHE